MGGRITEMFDFINTEAEDLAERKSRYCCFSAGKDEVRDRRAFLIANKIKIERKRPESGQINLF